MATGGFFIECHFFLNRFSLLPILLLWAMLPVQANNISHSDLAADPYWLALGHYRADGWLEKKQRSFIRDARFFLSSSGRYDPLAELTATIHAVDQLLTGDVDQHPVCRFPARYRWLSQQLQDKNFTKIGRASCRERV